MQDYLVVVDMQNDFIDGSLGTKEAESIVSKVVEKVKNFKGTLIFTRDTHFSEYLQTQEGRKLPVMHCIKGSSGWEICDPLETIRKELNAEVFDKITFGSKELAEHLNERKTEISSVTLCGLCTDICVISNAMLIKAFMPEVVVKVDSACCAGVTPESHLNALEAMKMCQIEII